MNLDKMPIGQQTQDRDCWVYEKFLFFFMSSEGCRPQPILLLLIFRQLQIPSSPFCNKITGFTHHGLQFFFLILKHFSFQKKKGFVGHLGPLPGFFQTRVWPQ